MMLLKLGRALSVALSCLLVAPSPALWAVSMPTPGQRLTLGEAVGFTLENHPRRMAADSEAGAAEQQVGEAKSAMLPQIYGAADYLGSTQNGIGAANYLNPGFIPRHNGAAGQPQAWSLENNYLGAVGASQYLFDFGRVRGEIAERRAQADAAGAELKLTELDLIFQTSQRYFALLAARQLVAVYEEAITQRQEQVHESKVKSAAALTPEIDVYTAQAQLARAETRLLAERNEVPKAKAALDNAMGLGAEAPDYEPAQTLSPSEVVGSTEEYIGAAMKLLPDLLALEDQARAAGAKVNEYRSDLFPTVNAAAGYNAVGTGLPAANNYNIGLVISWPIFNGMLTTHQIAEARLRCDAIEHSITDLR
jgi:outer membrane protein TolC